MLFWNSFNNVMYFSSSGPENDLQDSVLTSTMEESIIFSLIQSVRQKWASREDSKLISAELRKPRLI